MEFCRNSDAPSNYYFMSILILICSEQFYSIGSSLQTDEFTLHPIGTAAVAVQVTGTNWPEPAYTLLVTGLCRFKIEEILQETPYPVARVAQLENVPGDENGKYLCRCGL